MNLKVLAVAALLLVFLARIATAQENTQVNGRVVLPNGWNLTPAGIQVALGDLPLNIAVSPDRKYGVVTNNGQGKQSVQLIDLRREKVLDTHDVGKAWLGLAFGEKETSLYVSGGNDNLILHFLIENEKLICRDTFLLGKPWPEKISVAGIAADEKHHRLYAVTKENNSLYILETSAGKILKQIPLGGEGYTCILSPDCKFLYCTCWGCDKIIIVNTKTMSVEGTVTVGDNPNDMTIDRKGRYLFTANSNDNSVSVIDLKKRKVVETLNAALFPDSPPGSTTNSVALSKDGKRLYVANADNNCLAVFDVSKPGESRGLGFIPTGWYPDCVRIAGDRILVSNGKGGNSLPNPKGPNPAKRSHRVSYQKGEPQKNEEVQYIAALLKGTLSIIPVPDDKELNILSRQVYANTPYSKEKEKTADGQTGNPVPRSIGEKSPINYVFYVVKENRTYDQVLGDIREGNGDTNLVLFGEKYTPNQHAIAREFVLLDNFYVDAEVSADGHNWSLGAYATDYLEKTWPTSYGGRGGGYDAEGWREIANNKDGFLWDNCKRNGISYRTYGEFADLYKPNIPVLEGHYCPYCTGWDPRVMDTTRFGQWKREFDSLLAVHQLPRLNTLRFPNDHTEGLKAGRPTPFAEVADNDLAVGMLVDYLSKSPIWNECAIFILEDDAQNGPDHVDAHRSTAYVAGGFVKKGYVDHTAYSTSSMLRTIELILGIPPMTQYDAAAVPMWRCFDLSATHPPFEKRTPGTSLFDLNTAMNEWQRKSEEFDFGREDRIPDRDFNEVIWFAVKGDELSCPPPVHAAFLSVRDEDDD